MMIDAQLQDERKREKNIFYGDGDGATSNVSLSTFKSVRHILLRCAIAPVDRSMKIPSET